MRKLFNRLFRFSSYRMGNQPRLLPDVATLVGVGLPLVDIFLVWASALFLAWYVPLVHDIPQLYPLSSTYRGAVSLACLFTPLVLQRYGLYRSWRGEAIAKEIAQLAAAWLTVVALLAVVAVVTQSNVLVSRVWFFSWMCLSAAMLFAYRLLLRHALGRLRRSGWNQKTVYLIGWGEPAKRVVKSLKSQPTVGYRICGCFVDTEERKKPALGVPCLGDLQSLVRRMSHSATRVDQVWVAIPMEDIVRLRSIFSTLMPSLVDLRYVSGMMGFALATHRISHVAGLPLIHLSESPMSGLNRVIKAVEDRILAAIFLTVSLPFMLLIALGIKLTSPGPIIFKQLRHGWNGEQIEVWKFRTMFVQPPQKDYQQARRNDPRVTPLGRWLRRLSLDELPQFINVLRGEMSVVGPRPHPIQMNARYENMVDGYMLRHRVKPGITGWAQVNNYRGETPTLDLLRMRVEYDLYYIEHWSIWFDLFIVLLTVLRGLVSPRAY